MPISGMMSIEGTIEQPTQTPTAYAASELPSTDICGALNPTQGTQAMGRRARRESQSALRAKARARCRRSWSWAQSTGRAIPNGPGVVPQPSDPIVFGAEHVGIVEDVLPNRNIQAIEGNYENEIAANMHTPQKQPAT